MSFDSKPRIERSIGRWPIARACAVLLFLLSMASAPSLVQAAPPLNRTDEIVQMYCKNGGQLAVCIRRPASECDAIVRPLVVACEAEIPADASEAEQAEAYASCWGREFTGKYAHDVVQEPPCITRIDVPDAIKSPPPEFADKGGPLMMPPRSKGQ